MALTAMAGCGSPETQRTSAEQTTEETTETTEAEQPAEEAETEETAEETDEFQSDILFCGSTSLYPIMSSLASSFTEEYVTWDKVDSSFPEKNISIRRRCQRSYRQTC